MKKLVLLFLLVFFVSSVIAVPSFNIFEGRVSCEGNSILIKGEPVYGMVYDPAVLEYTFVGADFEDGKYSLVLNSLDGYNLILMIGRGESFLGEYKYSANDISVNNFVLPAEHPVCTTCGNGICDASETCLGCLADCNGQVAECGGGFICSEFGCTQDLYQCTDRDNDDYGIGSACLGPDCDDRNPNINPGMSDRCNRIDDNCNGIIDEDCNIGDDFVDDRRFSPIIGFFSRILDFLF